MHVCGQYRTRDRYMHINRRMATARGLVTLAAFIAIWEFLTTSGVISAQFLSSPSQIVAAIVAGYTRGNLWADTGVTLQRVVVGWAIGCALGYLAGLAIGIAKLANDTFGPLLELLRPISPVALVPVALLWFGIGNESKYFIIAFACFWPLLLNTKAGVARIPQLQIRVARVLHLNRWEQFVHVFLPATLPDVLVGLRLSAGIAFVVVVAAELVGATSGLGYEILEAEQSFRTPLMFGAVFILAILGLLANIILQFVRFVFIRWNW